MAPRKAPSGVISVNRGAMRVARIEPTAAPLETPRMNGSASGLRNIAWKLAPDTDRAAPTRMPSRMRGRRRSKTMRRYSVGSWSLCPMATRPRFNTRSVTEIGTAPKLSARTMQASNTTASAPQVQSNRFSVSGRTRMPPRRSTQGSRVIRRAQMNRDGTRGPIVRRRPPGAEPGD